MKRIFPDKFYNTITLVGVSVSAVSFGLILFLMVLEYTAEVHKPYMGILAFVILPTFLVMGLLIIAFGVYKEYRNEKAGKEFHLNFPRIDLNIPQHRTAFMFFSIGTLLFLVLSAFGSYKAYEYTDSDDFCGKICHVVMEPEFAAYQSSPHARVGCVKCHIGPGADWFVRAKISGAYQLYQTAFDRFPRPIPTPIENLRPAQETCEQCHWPKHFFDEKQRSFTYFLSDEQNTAWNLTLLMKIGGGNVEAGPTSGIHWHMNIANEVSYAATDRQRFTIPWVRVKTKEGVERVYRSTEEPIDDETLAATKIRRMDCVDCHNRPTHIYHPPERSINHIMEIGWIDRTLPSIKSVAVDALEKEYATKQEALDGIRLTIEEYYSAFHPNIAKSKKSLIEKAITEIQKIYSRNYFPEMKHDWRQYPDHIGHMYTPGCFRCHDGKHVSDDGKVLSKDCNTCHTILAQQIGKKPARLALEGLDYIHPIDIGNAWKEMNCHDCHTAR